VSTQKSWCWAILGSTQEAFLRGLCGVPEAAETSGFLEGVIQVSGLYIYIAVYKLRLSCLFDFFLFLKFGVIRKLA
jgi:hypothetical protein